MAHLSMSFDLPPTPGSPAEPVDPQDMHGAIRAFPDHLREGWTRGEAAEAFGLDAGDVSGVVVCGMGGSAIGADLVRALVEPTSPVPVQVVRGYDLPAWAGERALVVASSYSGGTEETLSAFGQARQRGARVVVVTSGGEIGERARADGLDTVEIPGGLQPRAALGYSLGVLLRLARAAGLHDLPDDVVEDALAAARATADRLGGGDRANPAVEIAKSFDTHLPVIYSGVGLLEPVAMRWRTQVHENAKHPAFGNVFPELDHNEIMAYEAGPVDLLRRLSVVVLRDRDDHPQVQRRFEITRELVAGRVEAWREVETAGDSRLARLLSLVQLGDWASYWLAARKGVDPTPVETIQNLKKALAA
jgi:glucose/mannose-6-phosphate isomerase